jgi:hypothetical protein
VQTDFSFPQVYLSPEDKGGRPTEVREKFRDTAHWAPAVVTDAQGRGSVEFALPDDLASWRATARAHSMATAVGTDEQGVLWQTARAEIESRLSASTADQVLSMLAALESYPPGQWTPQVTGEINALREQALQLKSSATSPVSNSTDLAPASPPVP